MKKKLVLTKDTIKTLKLKSNLKTGATIDTSLEGGSNLPEPTPSKNNYSCSSAGSGGGSKMGGGYTTGVAQ